MDGQSSAAGQLSAEIEALGTMPIDDLRRLWRRHYHVEPPARLSRDLLVRGIAQKLQENVHGGLGAAMRRHLRTMSTATSKSGAGTGRATRRPILKPGARLVREWHGRTHTVHVLDEGFEHEGQRYRSLTEIAKAITGTHWSGPRFFGLRGIRPSQEAGP